MPAQRRTPLPLYFQDEEMTDPQASGVGSTMAAPPSPIHTPPPIYSRLDEDSSDEDDSTTPSNQVDDYLTDEQVPLSRQEEITAALGEDGITDFNDVAAYQELDQEIGLSDADVEAAAESGGPSVRELAEEVEEINDATVLALGPLSAEEKKTGVFMFKKVSPTFPVSGSLLVLISVSGQRLCNAYEEVRY